MMDSKSRKTQKMREREKWAGKMVSPETRCQESSHSQRKRHSVEAWKPSRPTGRQADRQADRQAGGQAGRGRAGPAAGGPNGHRKPKNCRKWEAGHTGYFLP